MLRRIMIALASVIFVGAMAVSTTAEARKGGGFGGGGMRGGGFHGGGFHRGGFHGGGFHRGGFAGSRFASRSHVFHHGFARGHRFHHRPFFAKRFHHRRFAFAAVPFAVGASYYDDPCWRVRYTYWGPRYVNVCGYGYY